MHCAPASGHLLPLLRALGEEWSDGVGGQFLVSQPLEQRMRGEVLVHPCVQVGHVCCRVGHAPFGQHVGILGQDGRVDDPPLVLGLLEVGIGEEKEQFCELALLEEVGEVLHGVGANHGNVAVASRVIVSQCRDAVVNIVAHFDANFDAQHASGGVERREGHQQTTVATAYVCEPYLGGGELMHSEVNVHAQWGRSGWSSIRILPVKALRASLVFCSPYRPPQAISEAGRAHSNLPARD